MTKFFTDVLQQHYTPCLRARS